MLVRDLKMNRSQRFTDAFVPQHVSKLVIMDRFRAVLQGSHLCRLNWVSRFPLLIWISEL